MNNVLCQAISTIEADLRRAKRAIKEEKWHLVEMYLQNVNSGALVAKIAAKKIQENL